MKRLSARSWQRIATWITFLAALSIYLLTLEPDASLWDCPEYLTTAALLEVGHPPGNPVWTLTARIASLAGGHDPRAIAIAVNATSALLTAGAAAILTSLLFILFRLLPIKPQRDRTKAGTPGHEAQGPDTKARSPKHKSHSLKSEAYGPMAAAAIAGGLLFAWCDSPWYSAVEAEVYAMSLFLTALSVRLMTGWAFIRQPRRAARRLLLIVYLTGLSIGVHQLNLLVIPALALIWLFGRCHGHRRPGFLRILLTLLAACAAVGSILLGMMPGVIRLASRMELLCVNSLHLPLHSGVWIFWGVAMAATIALGLCPCIVRRHMAPGLQVILWIPAMLLTGYSSYMLILVRGAANTPMNEGAPANIFTLAEYLNRDQYGKAPLFYGRTPHSTPMRQERILPDGTPDYSRYARTPGTPRYLPSPDGKSYRHFADHTELIYTPELDMWLPRLTSQAPADIASYADWAGMTPADMVSVEVSYALDSLSNPVGKLNADGSRSRETELRPTYLQQARYLFGYQIGYMYFRYLLWNFAGRQNDRFASGEVEHGNFITGIPLADDAMLGPQSTMPHETGRGNPGRNRLYMVPLLLGIAGMVWLQRRGSAGRRTNLVIAVLFLMTGLAIVVYLNQSPREPRERDYSFLGSLWAYALWIGAGIWGTVAWGWRRNRWAGTALALASLLLPAWVLAVNYDDHDRSGRSVTTDFAANLLESLEPDAILFTNGDNFTFPLWWAQEVAGIRRDVTIVNTAYLATPWYVVQLMNERPGYGHRPMPGLLMQATDTAVRYGAYASTRYVRTPLVPTRDDTLAAVDAIEALRRLYKEKDYRMPAMLRIPAADGTTPIYIRSSAVASGSGSIGQRQLATLDIIASNLSAAKPRPVYWLSSLGSSDFAGFHPFTARTLHTRRYTGTDHPDTALTRHLLDRDLAKALESRSGRRGYLLMPPDSDRRIYADATVGAHITTQRLGMIRLAQRLLAARRPADALKVAEKTLKLYPPEIWEFQICNESEGPVYEGLALAEILTAAAPAAGADSLRVKAQGESLREREKARHKEWQRYYRTLPPHLRPMLTPKHRQWLQELP